MPSPANLNLLFIMFDDLRPELSVYNRHHMIDPNFQRLANRSVIFDQVYAQIAVCNPSRDSMLTGLRPDTVGTYQFQSSFRPHLIMQNQLVKAGYNTAGYGKIAHWETGDRDIWSADAFEGDWYTYQNRERNFMNSSTMPDKVWPEEKFRDHMFTERAVVQLDKFLQDPSKPFMLGIGFKNPHLQIHIPHKYYDMYKDRTAAFKLTKKEMRFPHSTPDVAYRCCAEPTFMFMNNEGAERANRTLNLGDVNMIMTDEMRNEMMLGYCAAITFVDKQLGKILDVMDKHNGWKNTVVVLTADHGMHNGEKAIWEKWSMFDESTRVPLFIYHPQTPFASKHYWDPVELLDVYPTLVDLLSLPYNHGTTCAGYEQFFGKNKVCHQLQGKSLARVVLGDDLHKTLVLDQPYQNQNKMRLLVKKEALKPNGENLRLLPANRRLQNGVIADNTNTSLLTAVHDGYTLEDILSHDWQSFGVDDSQLQYFQYPMGMYNTTWSQTLVEDSKPSTLSELTAHVHGRQLANKGKNPAKGVHVMPKLEMDFAISQSWRCAMMELVTKAEEWNKAGRKGTRPRSQWFDCDKTRNPDNELSIMGYSLRTNDFRYTSWFHYNRKMCIPILDVAPYDEELYDHRKETLDDFTHRELVNLVRKPGYEKVIRLMRARLVDYIKNNNIFRGCYRDG